MTGTTYVKGGDVADETLVDALRKQDWFRAWFDALPPDVQGAFLNDVNCWVKAKWFQDAGNQTQLLKVMVEHVWLKRALVPPAPGTAKYVARPSRGLMSQDVAKAPPWVKTRPRLRSKRAKPVP